MEPRYLLFEYGQLCIGDARPARAPGELRALPGDAAARFRAGTSMVHGQLAYKTGIQIRAFDMSERRGEPKWDRVLIKLDDGTPAYAYEYSKDSDPKWDTLSTIESGIWLPSLRST